ncbi:hypothetical protein [Allorhodopirellula solitaria]|uniref:Uncharacterized protein n=1 Tax=Allorhodopirellula solitaria TaxID=2527987 RepID=A0A5C5YEY5_9BACT|nr:hypothetical protein [Allorhodopirellula solitaria]TWT72895.1 hypothetical protein CA85_13560 [Allorhodopirellula solitaria]
MTEWTLKPQRGIERGALAIHFGMSRSAVRERMRDAFPPPQSHFETEDDFEHETDGSWIRVRYDDVGVQDIEFLGGLLAYNGVMLFGGNEWPSLQQDLTAAGNTLRDTKWLGDGHDCLPLAVNIATHEEVGGDGDGIEWVIMSTQFES